MAKRVVENLPPEEQICFENLDDILFRKMKKNSGQSTSNALFQRYRESDLVFSQFNMSMVHMAFFEAVVVYPKQVSISPMFYAQVLRS
jgi:hypothetical protein